MIQLHRRTVALHPESRLFDRLQPTDDGRSFPVLTNIRNLSPDPGGGGRLLDSNPLCWLQTLVLDWLISRVQIIVIPISYRPPFIVISRVRSTIEGPRYHTLNLRGHKLFEKTISGKFEPNKLFKPFPKFKYVR